MSGVLEIRHVPHVLVARGHVEIPQIEPQSRGIGLQGGLDVGTQRGQPIQFVGHMRIAQSATIGNIERPDLYPGNPHPQGARLQIGLEFPRTEAWMRVLAGKLGAQQVRVQTSAHRHRHAVPLVHAVAKDLVASIFERLQRKLVVAALDFLHRQDVYLVTFQQLQNPRGPSANRVHIPGSQSHRFHS